MHVIAAALATSATHPVPLPGFLATVGKYLAEYSYWAVLLLVMVENFGVPVPGETILIAAAVDAGTGRLSIVLVGITGFVAAVIGDNIGFAIGHFGGRPLAERYGRYIFLTPERLEKATSFFDRHGGKIIIVARFIEGLRQANGIIAGISGLRWTRFLVFNAIGAALWVAVWTSVGYFSGSHIDTIYADATRYDKYLVVALALVVAAYVALRIRRVRRARAPDNT